MSAGEQAIETVMEKYTKTELKKKIEEADKRIDDIDLQIDALREKRQE